MSRKKGNTSNGNPIRGKIDPFKKCLDQFLYGADTKNGFDIFRESLKKAIALRMQCMVSPNVKISEECFGIIKNCFQDDRFAQSFINCSLRYYLDNIDDTIQIDKSGSTCTSRDIYKSAKHALKDCEECSSYYIGELKKIKTNDADRMEKLSSMQTAIEFVSKYIFAMSVEELPDKLNEDCYKKINIEDNSISNLYLYNDEERKYKLRDSVTKFYKNINIELATLIFCHSYR